MSEETAWITARINFKLNTTLSLTLHGGARYVEVHVRNNTEEIDMLWKIKGLCDVETDLHMRIFRFEWCIYQRY